MEDNKDKKRPRPKDNSDEDDEDIEMKKEKQNDEDEGLYENDDSYESIEDNENDEENEDEDIKGEIKIKPKEPKKENNNNIKVNLWDEKKNNKLKEGEILDFNNDAYEMLHRSKVEWPCLSVDFLLKENSSLSSLKDFYLPNNKRKMTEDQVVKLIVKMVIFIL